MCVTCIDAFYSYLYIIENIQMNSYLTLQRNLSFYNKIENNKHYKEKPNQRVVFD